MSHIKLTGNQRLEGNIRIGFSPPSQAPAPSSPYNLAVVGGGMLYNPLTWDYDGPDPDYFLLEYTVSENPYAKERGYIDNIWPASWYDAKGNDTWYIPGNIRQVYVTYEEYSFPPKYKLRLSAETNDVLSDPSNEVECSSTAG